MVTLWHGHAFCITVAHGFPAQRASYAEFDVSFGEQTVELPVIWDAKWRHSKTIAPHFPIPTQWISLACHPVWVFVYNLRCIAVIISAKCLICSTITGPCYMTLYKKCRSLVSTQQLRDAMESSLNNRRAMHPLRWRHNDRDGISNHRRLDCLLNNLFRRRSKKKSKIHVTCLCEGKPPVTGGFPSQRASNAEN